jgi:hypothetical protein
VLIPGVTVTRYLEPAEDPAGTRAASAVYSFEQQAASPGAAPGPQASEVLARTFQTPAFQAASSGASASGASGAQQASVTASAVATPGAALDRLIASLALAGPSTFQVTASSTWESLSRYGPDNLFSAVRKAPWVASPTDTNPLLHLTWRGKRTIGELILSPASGTAFPSSVEVASPQGTRLASVGQGGVVRLVPPLRTSQLYVIFASSQADSAGVGEPVGLSGLTIPGLAGLRVAAPSGKTRFLLACGQGPTLTLDGKKYPTSVSGTVADLLQPLPVQVRLCTPGGSLTLSAGRHWLLATPSSVFAVRDLDLRTQPGGASARTVGTGPTAAAAGDQRSVRLLTWQADSRSLRIGSGSESYLEIHENFNAGWHATLNGRPLSVVRLDGWQQAFIVPAGAGGVITLSYGPAIVYHAGLIVSALALAALVAFAIVPGRPRNRRQRSRRQRSRRPNDWWLNAWRSRQPSWWSSRRRYLQPDSRPNRQRYPASGASCVGDPVARLTADSATASATPASSVRAFGSPGAQEKWPVGEQEQAVAGVAPAAAAPAADSIDRPAAACAAGPAVPWQARSPRIGSQDGWDEPLAGGPGGAATEVSRAGVDPAAPQVGSRGWDESLVEERGRVAAGLGPASDQATDSVGCSAVAAPVDLAAPESASVPRARSRGGRWPWFAEDRGRLAARTVAVFVPLAVVIWLAGGPVVVAVPVLACLSLWRPRWLPPVAFGAMLAVGIVAASSASPTALGSGAFSGLAQACALVALTAALMPEVARTAGARTVEEQAAGERAGPGDHAA